jgi:hypothetical protein
MRHKNIGSDDDLIFAVLQNPHRNAGQNQHIKIANRSFEKVSLFKHSEMTVTNRNLIPEKIKRRLNYGNACYHSVQNLLSSHPLTKNLQI